MQFAVNKQSGFTLLELLITIGIIGVLTSVVMVSVSSARIGGRDASRLTQIQQIKNAVQLYFSTNGYYPDTLATLVPLYMSLVPTDPQGNSYRYTGFGSGTGATCTTGYHLSIDLEKNNKVLMADLDYNSTSTAKCTGGSAIVGANESAGSAGCDNTTGGNAWCYDIGITP